MSYGGQRCHRWTSVEDEEAECCVYAWRTSREDGGCHTEDRDDIDGGRWRMRKQSAVSVAGGQVGRTADDKFLHSSITISLLLLLTG